MTTATVRTATELGSAVRQARAESGISQTQLATMAHVGRQWLVAFEAGDKGSAPLDMVFRVLQVLKLDVTLESAIEPGPARSRPRQLPRASDILARYEKE